MTLVQFGVCPARGEQLVVGAALGFALAIPLTWSYLIPEMIVFALFDHDALVAAMRITGR